MRLQDLSVGRKDVLMLDPRILVTRPEWNVRQDTPELREHIATLKASIVTEGVKEPYTVVLEGERVIIVNGHCRQKAVLELIAEGHPILAVPARPEDSKNAEEQVLSMITRNSGLPLSPMEKGEVFRRLDRYGWTEVKIAERSGASIATVRRLLALDSAPEELKTLVQDNKVSATTAAKQIQKDGPEKAAKKIKDALEETPGKKVRAKNLDPNKAPSDGGKVALAPTDPTPQHLIDKTKGLDATTRRKLAEHEEMVGWLRKAADAALSSRVALDDTMDEIIAWLEEKGMR